MVRDHAPKFAKRYAELGDAIVDAVELYVGEVRSGAFPAPEHAYKPNRADVVRIADAPPGQPRIADAPPGQPGPHPLDVAPRVAIRH
jgi:3-methyl-2-oxobutanoate hydroxymethyltransferase